MYSRECAILIKCRGTPPMADRVTSSQVAQRAGVSQSAVSRVYTPGASVSLKTKDKVRKAASELGYRPNVLARAMVSGKSRIIGLVVAYLENYFYPEAVEKFSNALQARGYHVMMFMASQTATDIDNVMEEILDYQVDGIIMASAEMSSVLSKRCRAAGVPVVLFNRSQDIAGTSAVISDNVAGGRRVAELFAAAGHTRIGYIAGWEGASTQRDREAGFMAGLNAAGQTLLTRKVGNFDFDVAKQAAIDMFSCPAKQRPDAVFVANDHMAIAVMDVLRQQLGLSVPADVSVVGFDDVPPASWAAYNLTTVRQRANLMVEKTVSTLLHQLAHPTSPVQQHTIDCPLILRESARIPEGWKDERI